MTTPTDTAKLADDIEVLAKLIRSAKANPPEPYSHIDGGERARAFEGYVYGLMSEAVAHLPTIIAALRELEAVKAESAKLREALEPFAREVGRFGRGNEKRAVTLTMQDRDGHPAIDLLVSDFVAARAAFLSDPLALEEQKP